MKTVSIARMRAAEGAAIQSGIPEFRLMTRAGRTAAAYLDFLMNSRFRRAVFFCGGGNNAGDALVCAGALQHPAVILAARKLELLHGAAAEAREHLPSGIPVFEESGCGDFDFEPGDLIVDALLGIGFTGDTVREPVAEFIRRINASSLPVVAFDLPSGLNGDTGICASDTVRATWTITFGAPKIGMLRGAGPEFCGKILAADIGLNIPGSSGPELFMAQDFRQLCPRPAFDCHKNSKGRVLILAGSREYPGAAALAAKGALYSGCGMVRLLSVGKEYASPLPDALIRHELAPGLRGEIPADALRQVPHFAENSDVLAAGSGWGGAVSPDLLKHVFAFNGKILLDADALNLLSRNPSILPENMPQLILTPHPGEAARLADAFGIEKNQERETLAKALARKLGAVVILKGFRSVIASPDGRCSVNGSGGPELAAAGSGDVLAGLVAGLWAQHPDAFEAACAGAFLHGAAGDTADRTLAADDLPLLIARRKTEILEWI